MTRRTLFFVFRNKGEYLGKEQKKEEARKRTLYKCILVGSYGAVGSSSDYSCLVLSDIGGWNVTLAQK